MRTICKQFDENLAHLAWSLWTELGVAGLVRKHQFFSLIPEELIILTSCLSEYDPRLRDEALDWCIHYHHFVSPIRLHILAKKYEPYIADTFSCFAETFNALAATKTKWAVLTKSASLKLKPSGKSILRSFAEPSMIFFRLRSLLGINARADIFNFLLTNEIRDFAISDLLELGYSKRQLAALLADLAASGVLSESKVRNQFRYSFARHDLFVQLLHDIPKHMTNWDRILAVLLPIRACLQDVEDTPLGVRAIDMRNLLNKLSHQLLQIQVTPPPLQNDLEAYWSHVTQWILELTASLAQGNPYRQQKFGAHVAPVR